ncbi:MULTISPECIES: amino acid-binding protein [unclassified Adlercreutzia]|uniref:amino acid-binding protein n=1 Tax=unclassified Adlercreutzia TaxID=2636013 RepID=UPI0013E9D38B|nr:MULTISPECIES: amino acid-binding protein [unclassified Adlercreutzia]
MVSQLSIFLQNEKGHLSKAVSTIADANINMHALYLADTQDFGVARVFCDTPDVAAKLLTDAGFKASVTPVVAVRIPNEPGGLARLLRFCDDSDMNIEYAYCFAVKDESAIDVLKINGEDVEQKLRDANFDIVEHGEIYAI